MTTKKFIKKLKKQKTKEDIQILLYETFKYFVNLNDINKYLKFKKKLKRKYNIDFFTKQTYINATT